jgi:hypothetical protein
VKHPSCRRLVAATLLSFGFELGAQGPPVAVDSVSVRIVNVDLRAAVQLLAQYVDRPVLFSGPVGPAVTLEAAGRVARSDVLPLLRSLVESQGYAFVAGRGLAARDHAPARSRGGCGVVDQRAVWTERRGCDDERRGHAER